MMTYGVRNTHMSNYHRRNWASHAWARRCTQKGGGMVSLSTSKYPKGCTGRCYHCDNLTKRLPKQKRQPDMDMVCEGWVCHAAPKVEHLPTKGNALVQVRDHANVACCNARRIGSESADRRQLRKQVLRAEVQTLEQSMDSTRCHTCISVLGTIPSSARSISGFRSITLNTLYPAVRPVANVPKFGPAWPREKPPMMAAKMTFMTWPAE